MSNPFEEGEKGLCYEHAFKQVVYMLNLGHMYIKPSLIVLLYSLQCRCQNWGTPLNSDVRPQHDNIPRHLESFSEA